MHTPGTTPTPTHVCLAPRAQSPRRGRYPLSKLPTIHRRIPPNIMFWKSSPTPSVSEKEAGSPQGPSTSPVNSLEVKLANEIPHQEVNSLISGNEPVSCLKAFDNLLSCYSISSQLKSIYRFGELNHGCPEKLNDFKFCLSLKTLDKDERGTHWNRRKAEKVLGRPNSEDVWEARSIKPLELTLYK
ncbi:hypothetical protein O181_012498 [Austropuccinia psidii MF-1]|uniref:Uncharacterized protein n=1 Tax=Austropuccinia psidii MF-1 TaxID=1389203 RepID=A0A9Q3BXE4_9BASI|nr:hypothetical protein [Austropuccinia psidii MF-1]